jgi:hypothetical protein
MKRCRRSRNGVLILCSCVKLEVEVNLKDSARAPESNQSSRAISASTSCRTNRYGDGSRLCRAVDEQIPDGSRCLVLCERDCAGCTTVTRAIGVDAPLLKRSSSRKASRKLQCAVGERKDGRNGREIKALAWIGVQLAARTRRMQTATRGGTATRFCLGNGVHRYKRSPDERAGSQIRRQGQGLARLAVWVDG